MATPVISVDSVVVGEKDGFAIFMIRLDAPSTSVVTVNFGTGGGTAGANVDFTQLSGTLTFAAGETVKTVQVPIIDDTLAETKEDFYFGLSGATNAVIGNTYALATIIDNDAASGTPVMAIGDRVVDESAGLVSFVVTLDRPSTGIVTAAYTTAAGTATAADFTAVSGTLAFAPGETAKTVTVPITNDTAAEAEETFTLVLSAPSGATLPDPIGTATIGQSDQPTVNIPVISVDNVTVGEADGFAEFVVRLNAPSTNAVTVNFGTGGGTAGANVDFAQSNGTLTFAAGETVKTVRVPIIDDTLAETKEDFYFDLSGATNAVIGNTYALATIIDNDAASGTPVMAIGDRVVDESAGLVSFVVTLDRPSTGIVTAAYTTAAGTATAADFTAVSGTLAFAPGETAKTVTVPITNDTAAEAEETFTLVLSAPSGATLPDPIGTATIGQSDQPTVSIPVISVDNVTVGEADGFAEFVVRLNAPSTNAVTVNFGTGGGTAGANVDFAQSNGTLTFAAGETVKTVRVPIIDDTLAETKEDFYFDLSGATNAVIGNTYALATIIDNDAASGTPVMAIGDRVVDESAGLVSFVVTLDRPSTGIVTAAYTTAAGTATAADFTAVSGTLAFAPGETAKTVTVPITNDTAAEAEETFTLVLSAPSGATLPDPIGTATIGQSDQPTVNIPVISVDNVTVGEADGFAEFVVRLNAPSTNAVTVNFGTGGGTAGANVDFAQSNGTLTFAAGETVKTVRVPIIDDTLAETKEDFYFDLSGATNAVIGNTYALATIIDNDAASGTPVMAIGDRVVDESAGLVSFVVTLDRPSTGIVTAAYTTAAGTATAADFTAVSGTLAFAPGETAKTVTVPITNDTAAEAEETFTLVLSAPSGATLPDPIGTATIGQSDQPTVSIPVISVDNVTVGEADGFAEFVVRLNAPSTNAVTVNFGTGGGTAGANVDFAQSNGTLTFAAGETVKTVRVPIIDDTLAETKEDFYFDLSGATNAVIGNTYALATIIDNDAASGTPVMAIGDRVVDESAGLVSFVVTLDRPSTGIVTAAYTTAAGTATAADFTAVSGTLAFAPGETAKTVTVPITNDTAAEAEETFTLVLSAPSGATLPDPIGTATIGQSDQPTVSIPVISVDNVTVGEADGFAEFVVRLNAPSTNAVTVNFGTGGGTAGANVDFAQSNGTLTFAAGETVKTVRVPIIDDTLAETKEDFYFGLSGATNAVIGNTYALATIIDNDAASGTPVMAIGDRVVDESAGLVSFVVTLDRPSTGIVTVAYTTAAGTATAADFTAVSGTLAFAPGETAKTVTVPITNDTAAEAEETFTLVLSAPSGATLPDPIGTATIGQSDQPTVSIPVISVDNVTVGEADGFAEFVVRLNAPSTNAVTVNFGTGGGTAGANVDFTQVSGTLTFAAGETVKTVRVPIIDDTLAEANENFFFNLSGATNATIAPSSAQVTATIVDNDRSSHDDFNGDGRSDILFRNNTTGDTGYWGMNGGQATWVDIGGSSTAYNVVGVGDFNGDFTADILWRNNTTGDTGFYAMPLGGGAAVWNDIGSSAAAYSVVGVGDFNGDGTADILFRNAANGDTGYWTMSGGKVTAWHDIGATSTAYQVVGVGDFNGSGRAGILWENPTTQDTGVFLLSAAGQATWQDLGTLAFGYAVAGVGDFNGDGISDILFRNAATGDFGDWAMNSLAQPTWHDLGLSSTAYNVVAVGDYTGDGTSDILWRNNSTGDTGYHAMSGGQVAAWHDIGTSSTAYTVPTT